MDKFTKIPKFMVFFILYLILTWNFEFIGSSLLMYYENYNAPLLVIIIIAISLLLISILKFSQSNLLIKIKEKSFFQIFTVLYLTLSIIFTLFTLLIVFRNWFYMKTPILLLLILFIGIIMLIHQNLRFISYFGFFIGILFFALNFLPIFCANDRNITFLTFVDGKFSNIWILFANLYLLLDILIYLPLNNHFSKPMTKKDLFILIVLAGFSAYIMMADNYLFLLPNAFSMYSHPALLKYQIYQLDPIGESLDFIIILDVIYLLIIKNSLSLFLIKNYQGIKSKSISYILLFILLLTSSYILFFMKNYLLVSLVMGISLSILILIYYIILTIISWKERKNGKQKLL